MQEPHEREDDAVEQGHGQERQDPMRDQPAQDHDRPINDILEDAIGAEPDPARSNTLEPDPARSNTIGEEPDPARCNTIGPTNTEGGATFL